MRTSSPKLFEVLLSLDLDLGGALGIDSWTLVCGTVSLPIISLLLTISSFVPKSKFKSAFLHVKGKGLTSFSGLKFTTTLKSLANLLANSGFGAPAAKSKSLKVNYSK